MKLKPSAPDGHVYNGDSDFAFKVTYLTDVGQAICSTTSRDELLMLNELARALSAGFDIGRVGVYRRNAGGWELLSDLARTTA